MRTLITYVYLFNINYFFVFGKLVVLVTVTNPSLPRRNSRRFMKRHLGLMNLFERRRYPQYCVIRNIDMLRSSRKHRERESQSWHYKDVFWFIN